MNASKENCALATAALERLNHFTAMPTTGAIAKDLALVKEFLAAAARRLPTEATFKRHTKGPKQKPFKPALESRKP